MTARPWQVWSKPYRRWPRVVRTYATRERAQAECDRNNAIVAANRDKAKYPLPHYYVKRRKP